MTKSLHDQLAEVFGPVNYGHIIPPCDYDGVEITDPQKLFNTPIADIDKPKGDKK
jgi:hypothetical protein